MPYPFSITSEMIIHLDKSSLNYIDITNKLRECLTRVGNEIDLIDDKIKIVQCLEFSSRATSFKKFNKGEINFEKSNERVKVSFRIYLGEHLIIFLFTAALGFYGLVEEGTNSLMLKIALLLLTANFLFCYLMPLMSLNSFVKDFNNRTINK